MMRCSNKNIISYIRIREYKNQAKKKPMKFTEILNIKLFLFLLWSSGTHAITYSVLRDYIERTIWKEYTPQCMNFSNENA